MHCRQQISAVSPNGDAHISFTITGMTLAQIVDSPNVISTSYDGEERATSVQDGGTTALLPGCGLVGLVGSYRKRS